MRGPATALARADLRDLSTLRATGDLVLAINSISPAAGVGGRPHVRRGRKRAEAGRRPDGRAASLESFEYLLDLARRRGKRLREAGRVDASGMFHESGETQKFFTSDEVRALCRASGLRAVSLTTVRYPWPLVARFGWGNFPGRPRLWDWYLVARAR